MVWVLGFIIILLIFFIISFFPISTRIKMIVNETEHHFEVKVLIFGICLYKKEKTITLGDEHNIWTLLEKMNTVGIDQSPINNSFLTDTWQDMKHVLHKVNVKQLTWKTTIGRDEAMWAGLYIGILWIIKGFVIQMISNQTHLRRKPVTEITPYLQRRYFHSEFCCMVSMRTGQAIHMLWTMLMKKSS